MRIPEPGFRAAPTPIFRWHRVPDAVVRVLCLANTAKSTTQVTVSFEHGSAHDLGGFEACAGPGHIEGEQVGYSLQCPRSPKCGTWPDAARIATATICCQDAQALTNCRPLLKPLSIGVSVYQAQAHLRHAAGMACCGGGCGGGSFRKIGEHEAASTREHNFLGLTSATCYASRHGRNKSDEA